MAKDGRPRRFLRKNGRGRKGGGRKRNQRSSSSRWLGAVADSSNRVHILNAGCSEHSAAACPQAVRFERLRRYIRNDLPSSSSFPPPFPWHSALPPVCDGLATPFFRGVSLSSVQSLPTEFHIDVGDGERPSSSYIIIEQNIMLADERPAAKMYYDQQNTDATPTRA